MNELQKEKIREELNDELDKTDSYLDTTDWWLNKIDQLLESKRQEVEKLEKYDFSTSGLDKEFYLYRESVLKILK